MEEFQGIPQEATVPDKAQQHAFVFDPTQVDMSNVREDCPYDVTPHLSS